MVSSKVRQPRHNVFVARNLLLTICNEKHLFQTNQVSFWIIQISQNKASAFMMKIWNVFPVLCIVHKEVEVV